MGFSHPFLIISHSIFILGAIGNEEKKSWLYIS